MSFFTFGYLSVWNPDIMRLPGWAQRSGVRLSWVREHSRQGRQAEGQAACPMISLEKRHQNQNLGQRETERKITTKSTTRKKTDKRGELNVLY